MKKILLWMISLSSLFLGCSNNEDSPPIHPLGICIKYENGEGTNLLHQLGLPNSGKALNLAQLTDLVEVEIEVKDSSSDSRGTDIYYSPDGTLNILWEDMDIFSQYNKKHQRKYYIKIKMPSIYGDDEFHIIETGWEIEGYGTISIQVIHQDEVIDFTNSADIAYIKIVL